jgi:hypothetical protein
MLKNKKKLIKDIEKLMKNIIELEYKLEAYRCRYILPKMTIKSLNEEYIELSHEFYQLEESILELK